MTNIGTIEELVEYLELKDTDELYECILSVGYTNAEGEYKEYCISEITESEECGESYFEAVCSSEEDDEIEDSYDYTFKVSRLSFVRINELPKSDK